MFYLEAFRKLDDAGVRYLVAGGVALNLHGVPRMTADLDLALALDVENLRAALTALAELGFIAALSVDPLDLLVEETRRSWVREKNLIAFPFHNAHRPYETIDLLFAFPLEFDAVWNTRLDLAVEGIPIHVLGLPELVAAKRCAGRPQDLADVAALERLSERAALRRD